MTKNLKPARTDTYEHTITGLLAKRRELAQEGELIRDRLAEIRNDMQALDRTLATLGYDGSPDEKMPRVRRQVIFGRGELVRAILDELRGGKPMRSREIAQALIAIRGDDPRDQRYIADLTRRVGKALRPLKDEGKVGMSKDQSGVVVWRLSPQKKRDHEGPSP